MAFAMKPLYETDFYAWANQQAVLLRARHLTEADIDNIAEEIESMGRSERRELISRLEVLLMHLLKWRFQPQMRGHSWRYTIVEQRSRLKRHLADNPSLKPQLPVIMAEAFQDARIGAAKETGLETSDFPSSCEWTYEQVTDEAFWPAGDEPLPC